MTVGFRLPALPGGRDVPPERLYFVVSRWLKRVGDKVTAREKLLEAYSEQFDWDIPAPCDGVLETVLAAEGVTVRAGDVLAVIAAQPPVSDAEVSGAAQPVSTPSPLGRRVSPLAANIAAAHQVDPAQVPGTGSGGRVTRADMLAFIASRAQQTAPSPVRRSAQSAIEQDTWLEWPSARLARAEQIARANRDIPHVTLFVEVNLGNVVAQCNAIGAAWRRREGFDLDHLPYVVMASVSALKTAPTLNGAFVANSIGVIMPQEGDSPSQAAVIRNADLYNLVGIARRLRRAEPLSAGDEQDGAFTLRFHSGALATAMLLPGQIAMLTVGVLRQCAIGVNDAVQIHPLLYLGLTYDARMVADLTAEQFLGEIKRLLEAGVFR